MSDLVDCVVVGMLLLVIFAKMKQNLWILRDYSSPVIVLRMMFDIIIDSIIYSHLGDIW